MDAIITRSATSQTTSARANSNTSAMANIQKVAVLGAGVMGAQIAAHFANVHIPVYLFDLPGKKDPNEIVQAALKAMQKQNPAPFAAENAPSYITPCNYQDDLEKLKNCDLIIEAVVEQKAIKKDLYTKVAPFIQANAFFASNTSGLGIEQLASYLPAQLQARFFGMHFFNPPRYMPLLELIVPKNCDKDALLPLETFIVSTLGKSVVYAKDTPNFIANRIGVYSMLITCVHAKNYNIPFEVVDQLTGKYIGRAKSATFRTADLVGLDVFAHVVATMDQELKEDPFHKQYQLPDWLCALIEKGALGAKTKAGIYKKKSDGLYVWDLDSNDYRLSDQKASKAVKTILKEKDWALRLEGLRNCEEAQAQFLWACFRDLFHYCAATLPEIAENARDVDLAIRWGFGWSQGPFEIWQEAGFSTICDQIKAAIDQKQSLVDTPLAAWTFDKAVAKGVFTEQGAYAPLAKTWQKRSDLAIYQRHFFPDALPGESFDEGTTLYENDGVRLWHQGDDIGILSFKSKMNTMGDAVLVGIEEAIVHAQEKCRAMVIWQRHGENFSVGANLQEFAEKFMFEGPEALEAAVAQFQITVQKVRYARIPVIAAVHGMVLGGGCELMMHCDQVVAALETYVGLVEVGVGILPAGSGCKEMAYRAAQAENPKQALEKYYKNIAMGEVAKSAYRAKEMGYLQERDLIVAHKHELLYIAKKQASLLADLSYHPPQAPMIPVFGMDQIATIKMLLVNMRDGGFISKHDDLIATKIASVMCGGDLNAGTLVDSNWFLRLERQAFMELILTQESQDRVQYMLEKGKPLRN